MPAYLRPRVGGAVVMFTVAVMDRGSRVLVEHVSQLREAVRATRACTSKLCQAVIVAI